MTRYIMILCLVATATLSQGQTLEDAVRYTDIYPLGTARTVGVGTSYGAMGGDFSVISVNPAGIAVYFKDQFTLTPGFGVSNTDGTVGGATVSDSKTGIGIDNIGYVSSNMKETVRGDRIVPADWLTSNWAVGLTKSKSFNRSFQFNTSGVGSITERWVQLADGLDLNGLDDFETYPAYQAGVLIDNGDNTYDTDYLPDDIVEKQQTVVQSGYISELALGWGTSYKNKFNFGISMGLPLVSFEEEKIYRENVDATDEGGNAVFQNDLAYTQNLNTTGTGVNFKVGMIYNLSPIRIGLAAHTPTWYSLEEDFDTEVAYSYTYFGNEPDSGQGAGSSIDGNFTYNLNTPWRFIGSVGSLFKLGKVNAFLNADIEYLNYSSTRFDLTADSDDFGDVQFETQLNNQLSTELSSGVNIRLGGEVAISKWRARAGFALLHNPYSDLNSNSAVSVGLGYNWGNFFMDLGYRMTMYNETYVPYLAADPSRDVIVDVNTSQQRVALTFGTNF